MVQTIRVAGKSDPKQIARVIAYVIRRDYAMVARTIGAGALNQAVKAIIIARGYLSPNGISIACQPSFEDVEVKDKSKRITAINLLIFALPS